MDDLGGVITAAIKMGGSVIGAALALIYLQPKTVAEFTTRSAFSVIAGYLFSDPLRDWMKWPAIINYELASATLAAMLSWFVMGAVVRIIEAWRPK